MKKRDSKGRFSRNSDEEDNNLVLTLPSVKNIILWISIIFVLSPWLIIISKFNVFQKLENIFDILYKERNEEIAENGKKSGLFY